MAPCVAVSGPRRSEVELKNISHLISAGSSNTFIVLFLDSNDTFSCVSVTGHNRQLRGVTGHVSIPQSHAEGDETLSRTWAHVFREVNCVVASVQWEASLVLFIPLGSVQLKQHHLFRDTLLQTGRLDLEGHSRSRGE